MDAVEEPLEGDLFVGGTVVECFEQGVPSFRLGAALGEQVGQGERRTVPGTSWQAAYVPSGVCGVSLLGRKTGMGCMVGQGDAEGLGAGPHLGRVGVAAEFGECGGRDVVGRDTGVVGQADDAKS